ncbi:MAG: Maf family protein [Woeseiaceae bacterium]|nr:Maf family protein [Woeseiaceae bacterium]
MPFRSLHLASASPRRAELLRNLGLEFTAAGVDIDETRRPGESPHDMVLRLALAKATAADSDADIVIGSDTAVVLGDEVFGKPVDQADGLRMLSALSGRSHEVMTAVAARSGARLTSAISVTSVQFREFGRDEALAYWQSGEPCDKAGAYGIQGLGGVFVKAIEGSYSGVVGLPVYETALLLAEAGLPILDTQVVDD